MKTIILIRHSEPIKDRTVPTEVLPLSEQGNRKASALFSLDLFRHFDAVYSSPYQRAYSTAQKLCESPIIDRRLRERKVGSPQVSDTAFWRRQYDDYDYKSADGESLNDTKERMTAVVNEMLSGMQEGETVAAVSHAAAICALLLNWCSVAVVDEQKKERRISWRGTVVLNGRIAMPGAFILHFENDRLCKISYMDGERQN